MKNIEKLLSDYGVEIPEEKMADFKKEFNSNYKTVAEFEKKESLIETLKEKAESANETIEKFKDIDVDAIKGEVEEWKKKYENAESDYNKKVYERDFNDALEKELSGIKFTSNSAKEAVKKQIVDSGLQLKDGKLYGFNDFLADIKEKDGGAFVDEEKEVAEEKKVKFTTPITDNKPTKATRDSILAIKDNAERRKAIADNPELFV